MALRVDPGPAAGIDAIGGTCQRLAQSDAHDHDRFLPFWEHVESLGVPVYLHPRDPLPANQGVYAGHPVLMGTVWSFTVENATHALRLMTSGPFDRLPRLKVILGHLGEPCR